MDVGEFGDTWFWWGMDGDVHFYYYQDWTLYCYDDYLYVHEPSYWGVEGWNWYWSGYDYYYDGHCYDLLVDTWYWWGYDMEWYTENGENYYCYYGWQYVFDPSAWGYYPGWTWVWNGYCDDDDLDVGEFGDTWFWWGMDGDVHFYYYQDWTLYCYYDYLYVHDPDFWGVEGWNWYWSGYDYYYDGHCYDLLDDTWYWWG